jgi:hypothetical protein
LKKRSPSVARPVVDPVTAVAPAAVEQTPVHPMPGDALKWTDNTTSAVVPILATPSELAQTGFRRVFSPLPVSAFSFFPRRKELVFFCFRLDVPYLRIMASGGQNLQPW